MSDPNSTMARRTVVVRPQRGTDEKEDHERPQPGTIQRWPKGIRRLRHPKGDEQTTRKPSVNQDTTASASKPKKKEGKVRRYLTRRVQMVNTAYEERAEYLNRTRTYPFVIPTRRATDTHNVFVRLYTLLARLIGTRYTNVRRLHIILMVVCFFMKKSPPPYFPRPRMAVRKRLALTKQRRALFYATKVVSVFVIKGGLGKTTRAILRALSFKRDNPELNVLVQDVDNGTLIDRMDRTTQLSMIDAVENLKYIDAKSDLARYCTRTTEGLYVMAYKRPDRTRRRKGKTDESAKTKKITREEMRELIQRELGKMDLIVNDLAPSEDDRNLGALDETHRVEIIMTPARDARKKALDTFEFLIDSGYEELASNALIVVNRRMRWTNLDKIYREFADKFPEHMDGVRITSMNFSIRFSWGWNVLLRRLSRPNRIKLIEDNAMTAEALADAFIDDPSTQKTHIEAGIRLPRAVEIPAEEIVQPRDEIVSSITNQKEI